MTLAFNVIQPDGPRANCAAPEALPVVDAAFDQPGGSEAQYMKAEICPGCPVGNACLAWAMERREGGIWGATGPNQRTRRGGPRRMTASAPRRIIQPYQPKAAADVPASVLRAWALEHGYPINPIKGRISEEIREAYDAARGAA